MGNIFTSSSNDKNFSELLDKIASKYILSMDFKNLKNLNKKEYCDNLVFITSDVLKKYFNPDGSLKYTIEDRPQLELHPEKWDTEVLGFFKSCMNWRQPIC